MTTLVKATVQKPGGVWRKGVLLRIKEHEKTDYISFEDMNEGISYEVELSTVMRIISEYYGGKI